MIYTPIRRRCDVWRRWQIPRNLPPLHSRATVLVMATKDITVVAKLDVPRRGEGEPTISPADVNIRTAASVVEDFEKAIRAWAQENDIVLGADDFFALHSTDEGSVKVRVYAGAALLAAVSQFSAVVSAGQWRDIPPVSMKLLRAIDKSASKADMVATLGDVERGETFDLGANSTLPPEQPTVYRELQTIYGRVTRVAEKGEAALSVGSATVVVKGSAGQIKEFGRLLSEEVCVSGLATVDYTDWSVKEFRVHTVERHEYDADKALRDIDRMMSGIPDLDAWLADIEGD